MRVADVPSGVSFAVLAAALLALHGPAHAQDFNITNLVSDGFVPAANIDLKLVNPWGVATRIRDRELLLAWTVHRPDGGYLPQRIQNRDALMLAATWFF